MGLGHTRHVTLACSSPYFVCGPRPLIPHFGFSSLGSPWLGEPLWMGPCQVIVPLVPALQKVWRNRLWSRQAQVFYVRPHWTGLNNLAHFFKQQKLYSSGGRVFPQMLSPTASWVEEKCAQDKNKGSQIQLMPLGLRGGPGRHLVLLRTSCPVFSSESIWMGRNQTSIAVIFWERGWEPRADPWCRGCPDGAMPAAE